MAAADTPLGEAARSVAHALGAVPPGTLVVASKLTSDVPAPRGDELALRVASLVAGALGSGARAEGQPASLAVARARAGAARAADVVVLDVRVEAGELRVTADLYPVVLNAWDRLRGPSPPPSQHAFVHVPVGAEVRAYLPPLHLEHASVTRFAQGEGPVLALACGVLDGQRGPTLVLVTDRAVVAGYLSSGRFVAVARAPTATLGARVPVPFREPLATAVFVGGEVYVGLGDRVGGVLGAGLAPRAPLVGFPVWTGTGAVCADPDPADGGFDDAVAPCAYPRPRVPAHAARVVDAWAGLALEDGGDLVATHEPSGTLRLHGWGSDRVARDTGAQVALVDLDQDGAPEVVTTMARGDDAIVVSTLAKDALVERRRWVAPQGVRALAACPPDVGDAPSVVAAVGEELWLVR